MNNIMRFTLKDLLAFENELQTSTCLQCMQLRAHSFQVMVLNFVRFKEGGGTRLTVRTLSVDFSVRDYIYHWLSVDFGYVS